MIIELEKNKLSKKEIQKICDYIDNEDSKNKNERQNTPYVGRKNTEIGIVRDVTIEDLLFY